MVLVILEIDAHIAEMRIVERFEGVESLGIDLDGAVASDQLAVEEINITFYGVQASHSPNNPEILPRLHAGFR